MQTELQEKKRLGHPWIVIVVFAVALSLGILVVVFAVHGEIYEGFYSAINENRASVSETEYIRDLYWKEGVGRLSTCDLSGESVDIIGFSSYKIKGDTITFFGLSFYGEQEGRNLTQEPDGSYSLSLPFSLKDGGFILGHCHYERIEK